MSGTKKVYRGLCMPKIQAKYHLLCFYCLLEIPNVYKEFLPKQLYSRVNALCLVIWIYICITNVTTTIILLCTYKYHCIKTNKTMPANLNWRSGELEYIYSYSAVRPDRKKALLNPQIGPLFSSSLKCNNIQFKIRTKAE